MVFFKSAGLMPVVCGVMATLASCNGKAESAGEMIEMIEINVASYNLRMDTESDGHNAWPYRREMVKGLIGYHDFDIMGTQEAFRHMLDELAEMDGYAYFGSGRYDGMSEEGPRNHTNAGPMLLFFAEDCVANFDFVNFNTFRWKP